MWDGVMWVCVFVCYGGIGGWDLGVCLGFFVFCLELSWEVYLCVFGVCG